MPDETIRQYLFDRPGQYQIRVLGALDQCWLDHLEELQITTSSSGGSYQVTQISGWLSDQTALAGLLELLNDLGMVILTVNRLRDDQGIE
ncbi:MAG: hypothetical protein ACKOC5_14900 [Chloroflexota bacterium]